MLNNKQTSQEVMLSIQGMNCSACATRIEKVLSKDNNIEHVTVSYPLRTAWIQVRQPISPDPFISKIKKLGFHAKLMSSIIEDMQQEKRKLGWRLILSLFFTLPLLIPMLLHIPLLHSYLNDIPVFIFSPFIQIVCATFIQLLIALPFYINAYHAIREKIANMDVLVVLGTSAAYVYSHYELFQHSLYELLELPLHIMQNLYFETTGVVISAVLLGKYIELKTAIKLQLEHKHDDKKEEHPVNVLINKQIVEKNSDQVEVGEFIVLQKHDYSVLDGIVVDGHGYVEEGFITGESGWIEKQKEHLIWGGSTVCEGTFIIKVTKSLPDTRLATIKRLIRTGQAQKSKLQTQIDTLVSWFVPFILLVAVAALALYFIVPDAQNRILAFISVLLVACPCALGLATPISMSIASSAFLRKGLVINDSAAVERLAKVNHFVFDKTGTLTNGQLKVSFFHCWKGNRTEILKYLAALEKPLDHPIAEAIKRYASKENIILPSVQFWQHYVGMGVGGYINKKHIIVGNERLLQHLALDLNFTANRIADSRFDKGETVIFVYEEKQLIAIIGLTDSVKASLKEVIKQLEQRGIQTTMATGDHPVAADNVARQLGIKHIYSTLLPEQKLDLISQLKQRQIVAMVGDGINDAPALAISDVAFVLSHGNKETLETSHIVLLHTDMRAIPAAINISRLTVNNIKQNLFFAFAYNIIMLPIAVAGILEPWMAGVAMSLSSVLVVGNSLRLHLHLSKSRV